MRNLSPVLFLVVSAGLLGLGCSSSSKDYTMGQTIEMGPFAFQVESASASTVYGMGFLSLPASRREIRITFKVLEDQSGGKIDFGDFLNNLYELRQRAADEGWSPEQVAMSEELIHASGMSMPDTNTKLMDSHGHSIIGGPNAHRGPSWFARYQLSLGVRDTFNLSTAMFPQKLEEREDSFRKEHLEMQPGDFQLIITNPDRRKGQPHTVSIQLQ